MKFILSATILFFFQSYGQYGLPKTHGTLVVAVICNDGILMAADSRASFTVDSVGELATYAYVDSFRKIMPIGNFQIGTVGVSSFKNKHLIKIIQDYNKKNISPPTVLETYNKFRNYLRNDLSLADSLFEKNQFFTAGYEDGNPIIIAADTANKAIIQLSGIGKRIYSSNFFKPYFDTIVLMSKFMITSINYLTKLLFLCFVLISSY